MTFSSDAKAVYDPLPIRNQLSLSELEFDLELERIATKRVAAHALLSCATKRVAAHALLSCATNCHSARATRTLCCLPCPILKRDPLRQHSSTFRTARLSLRHRGCIIRTALMDNEGHGRRDGALATTRRAIARRCAPAP